MKSNNTGAISPEVIEVQQKIVFWKNEPACDIQRMMLARYRKILFELQKHLIAKP